MASLLRGGLVSVLFFLLSGLCLAACAREPGPATSEPTTSEPASPPVAVPAPPPAPSITSFAVYTLSRGAGVPPEAREALEQVTSLVEADRKRGVKVTSETTYIGLEGEKRLCAEYEDPKEGTRAWELAGAIVKGVDLVNLAAEPCRKKEETP